MEPLQRKTGTGRRMTPDEVDEIVRLRLAGVPVRAVAAQLSCHTRTVVKHFRDYLGQRAKEFAAETDIERARILDRLSRIADDAASLATTAEKEGDRARALAEERQALAQMAKLLGLEVQKVEHSGDPTFTVLRIVERVDEGPSDPS